MNLETPLALKPLLSPRRIAFHGHAIELRPSGALYFPEIAALAVADLHLGKAMHFSAQGHYLPPYETDATLEKLDAETQATGARQIVLLGDAFHSARLNADPEFLPRMVELIARRAAPVFVLGNHDRPLARELEALSCEVHEEWRIAPLRLRHEPAADGEAQIFGHLHPCARVSTRAGRQRRRCFIVGTHHIAMPAFGALTGGLDIAAAALAPYARGADLYMI
jgi:DNA ligase-associated metallophosphoesterase